MAYNPNYRGNRQYEKGDDRFVNPYHFIPLEDGCKRRSYSELREQDDLLTGWIECKLETLTPIFIPNTNNDDFYKLKDSNRNKVNSYDFYSYQDNSKSSEETKLPIIGGSSLRGTLRSAFEAITNSCLSTTDDKLVLYKRTSAAGKLGILKKENETWVIQPCERYAVSVKYNPQDKNNFSSEVKTLKEGEKVYFTKGINYKRRTRNGEMTIFKCIGNLSTTKTEGKEWLEGYYHHGESFSSRKHHETIFHETNERPKEVLKRAVESLLESYKLYQDETVNLHLKKGEHDGYKKALPNAKYRDVDDLNNALIYYTEYQGNYYLSPAAVGREVFNNNLKKLLDNDNYYPEGSYSPCSNREELCPACSLFGFVSDEDQIASRVRFSDAKPTAFNFLEPVIIPELSGPKVSATEMYFIGDDDYDLWNADYATPNKPNYEAKIHGRKFYWHHDPTEMLETGVEKFSNRNVKIRPLGKESKFSFKIHFNNISKEELKQLLWTLTLGNNSELAHKIGMAKPLGLGSIRIDVNSVQLRKLSLSEPEFYTITPYEQDYVDYQRNINPSTFKVLKLLFNFQQQQRNVSYPYALGKNGYRIAENYDWFVGNKQTNRRARGMNPIIDQCLNSLAIQKDPSLFVVINNRKDGDIEVKESETSNNKAEQPKEPEVKDKNIIKIEKLIDIKDYEVYFTRFRELSAELNPDKYQNKLNEQITKKVTQLSEDIRSDKNINNLINTLEMVIKYKDCFTNNLAEMIAGAVRKRNDFEPKTIYSPKPKYRETYDKFIKELKLN